MNPISRIAQFSAGSVMVFTVMSWLIIGTSYLIGTTFTTVAICLLFVGGFVSKPLRSYLLRMLNWLMRAGRKFFLVPNQGDIESIRNVTCKTNLK